ncbi:MAG: DNA repair protein RadC [Candidatus Berkelbacteria bacterium]
MNLIDIETVQESQANLVALPTLGESRTPTTKNGSGNHLQTGDVKKPAKMQQVFSSSLLLPDPTTVPAVTSPKAKITSTQSTILYVRDQASRRYRRAQPTEIVDAAQVAINELFPQGTFMDSIHTVRTFLTTRISTREREVFLCLFLDNKHRLIQAEELFLGSIDSSPVFPREVVKRALHFNCAAVIFAHNHPSGNQEPSPADFAITRRLKEALALVEVRVIDHFVIGGTRSVSLAERGHL